MKPVTEVFAIISENPEDNAEGIVSIRMGDAHFPMVCNETKTLESMKEMVRAHLKVMANKRVIKVKRFEMISEEPL